MATTAADDTTNNTMWVIDIHNNNQNRDNTHIENKLKSKTRNIVLGEGGVSSSFFNIGEDGNNNNDDGAGGASSFKCAIVNLDTPAILSTEFNSFIYSSPDIGNGTKLVPWGEMENAMHNPNIQYKSLIHNYRPEYHAPFLGAVTQIVLFDKSITAPDDFSLIIDRYGNEQKYCENPFGCDLLGNTTGILTYSTLIWHYYPVLSNIIPDTRTDINYCEPFRIRNDAYMDIFQDPSRCKQQNESPISLVCEGDLYCLESLGRCFVLNNIDNVYYIESLGGTIRNTFRFSPTTDANCNVECNKEDL